ncbi:hypothetical protein DERF_015065 [Dermatophagoides farinae]|uniref:Tc1-like transposase DDE domain-containing protein n=1 Tax=Dermatophagoides farinae TaxID=6954 RepID=A0A922HQI1_DERFA|nr:hypothetical protein DERF_015065 [Dermatophagoides farinae]
MIVIAHMCGYGDRYIKRNNSNQPCALLDLHGGRSELRLCSNGMNSEEYINMLETTLFPIFRDRRNKVKKRNFLFQEDGAPCHMSKRSQDFIKKSNIKKLEWVAQSPDMNPIEHLWYSLKRRLKQTKLHPSTPVGLFELLVK